MTHEIPMTLDDGQQREQMEREIWEEYKKQMALLDELLSEERKISERFNHIFGGLYAKERTD